MKMYGKCKKIRFIAFSIVIVLVRVKFFIEYYARLEIDVTSTEFYLQKLHTSFKKTALALFSHNSLPSTTNLWFVTRKYS